MHTLSDSKRLTLLLLSSTSDLPTGVPSVKLYCTYKLFVMFFLRLFILWQNFPKGDLHLLTIKANYSVIAFRSVLSMCCLVYFVQIVKLSDASKKNN